MGVNFTARDSSAFYRLMADHSSDIIFKTDCAGFIVHASPAIERLGVSLRGTLIGPHMLDLVHPESAVTIGQELEAALGGRRESNWLECRMHARASRRAQWFETQLQSLADDRGRVYGVLGILRSLEERRALEERLFAAALTDPLTGTTNRRAFVVMLQHLLDEGTGGCMALFAIDHFKAINMKYGQSVGDEVLVAFANFLRPALSATDIVSRIGGDKLGVLLPGSTPEQAEAACRTVVDTLSTLGRGSVADGVSITASAGIAPIAGSLDGIIQRAEMALFFARANGRCRVEMDRESRAAPSRRRRLRTAA